LEGLSIIILGKFYPRSLLYLFPGFANIPKVKAGAVHMSSMVTTCPSWEWTGFLRRLVYSPLPIILVVGQVRGQFAVAPPAAATKYVRVLSPTAPNPDDGYRSTARKHGDFPGNPETVKSVRLCFQQSL
jgi:hypothetical protein